ncbi:ComEA family DNA-binding protein [Streptomyces sp. JHA26]|uniref:ComEA family DNA-binding protein n=1 Tax=Streptomyces sp. JHA26 TaxID=1917143 RepID=UPI00098B1311|nr:ComEA family DNA-binding protein [Streptomyces sp. JHA26]
MALRSRPRTAAASSGPGRGPASDGRTRPSRHRPHPRGRARHRHAPEEELRRRAEALFAEPTERTGHAEERREAGTGPPGGGAYDDSVVGSLVAVPSAGHDDRADPGGPDAAAPTAPAAPTWRERGGPALRERMPVWLQNRCGMEPRSVTALAVLLVVAAVFAAQHFWTGRTETVAAPEVVRETAAHGTRARGAAAAGGAPATGAPRSTATAPAGAEIVVDVGGKVREPGIHHLPAGSRVEDALRAAGGVRPGTKTDGLNRARFLVDGEQVIVGASVPPGAGTGPGGTAPGGPAGAVTGAAPVSLGTATAEQLETLPGVGPALARRIIDYRTQHGGFRSVDELREVNGIGERRFADLRDLVRP